MKIGITYDLRDDYRKRGLSEEETAEFDPIETIDGIDNAIKSAGYETERIGNVRSLMEKLLSGKRWDMVFNICEGLYGTGRESMVPCILDEFQIPYVFSDPLVLAVTLHKGITKTIIRNAGLKTADFIVAENINGISCMNLDYPLFVKPACEGAGKGIDKYSKVSDYDSLKKKCEDVFEKFKQPVIIEKYLPGKDFTVSIIGTGSGARVIDVINLVMTKTEKEDYFSFENKDDLNVEYVSAGKKDFEKCAELALQAWNILGCRDAGRIDIRYDENDQPNFIEVNPLAEINPEYSELTNACKHKGISYNEMIRLILDSATARVNSENPK
jgi:D-alanine-D-alanine ligase